MLTAYVQGAQVKSPGGGLPLHYASQFNASDVVAELITSAYPEATRERDVAGNLPLHLACQYQATEGFVSTLIAAYREGAEAPTPGNGSLPLHYAAAHESADEVVTVLLTAHREACRTKDAAGNLPMHLAYAKSIQLARVEKEKLNDRKVAEITQAQWHADGVDAQKFKMQIKEVDEFADAKTKVHKAAVAAVAANAAVMKTLLQFTFETEGAAGYANVREAREPPTTVPGGVLLGVKEKLPVDEWLAKLEEARKNNSKLGKETDRFGNLLLHRAVVKKVSVEVIEAVLACNKDAVKEPDGGGAGMLPLHLAIQNKAHDAVVLHLLAQYPEGCRVHESHEERLPLHFACEKEASDAVVSALLTAHFEASRMATTKGYLPLHIAAERDTTAFVLNALLMAAPDSPKAAATNGCLPLHRAVKYQAQLGLVRALLDAYPAAASTKDVRGCLPLHWAAGKLAAEDVVEALLAAHPEAANTADNEGSMPLHAAVEYEASDAVVHMLVDRCPQACRAVNLQKKRPIDLAYEHGASYQIVERLEQGATVARNEEVPLLAWLWGQAAHACRRGGAAGVMSGAHALAWGRRTM